MLNISSASRVLCYFLFALPGGGEGGGGGGLLAYEGYKGTSSGIK